MTKTKMNTLLATTAVLALAACGGSGDGSATNPTQPPPTDTVSSANVVEDKILTRRPGNPSQGLRLRADDTGKLDLWFDNELAVNEDISYIPNTAIIGTNVEMYVASGNVTGGNLLIIEGIRSSSVPSGEYTYTGDSFISYDASSASQNRSESFSDFGTMTARINFNSESGTISTVSNDNLANLNIEISSIDTDGKITGNGRFEAFGKTFTVSNFDPTVVGSSLFGSSTFNYDRIDEQSEFHGHIFGTNGQEMSGIGLGSSHVVGVVGSR